MRAQAAAARPRPLPLLALLALLLVGPASAQDERPQVRYEVVVEGPIDAELRELLEEVSESRRLTVRPPPSLIVLRRRVADDEPRLLQALRSRGYYAARIEAQIDTDVDPVRVVFAIEPGEPYRLEPVVIRVLPPEDGYVAPEPAEIGLAEGRIAESAAIVNAEAALLRRARREGHALAALGERTAVVDHRTQTMDLTLRFRPGPKATLGEITFLGLRAVEEDFLRRRLPWAPSDPFDPERIEEGRRDLLATGLFSSVRFRMPEELDEDGRLPVTIEVTERLHRSVGVGARYRTDEGPGVNVFWEHRNIFRRGERVSIETDASFIGVDLRGSFRKPDFRRRAQDLIADARLGVEDTDAFRSRTIGAGIGLERTLRPGMVASAGIAYRGVQVRQAGVTDEFALLSLPTAFEWDRSDSLLDPTRGGRLTVRLTPFVDTLRTDLYFARLRIGYAHYLRVAERPRVVLAGRLGIGSMVGASRGRIPADERFYAGGGGSVRGIGFQLASPLDDRDRPLGGRSLIEGALEVRLRLTDTVGFVLFADAGRAFESVYPDFSDSIQVGIGAGLRYHTPIGPVRLDVGVPLDRRRVDDAFQLYVSLGQAF